MAAHVITEEESEEEEFLMHVSYPLKQFIKSFSLPQTVKVTEGYYSEDIEFSAADVLVLKELNCEEVTFHIHDEHNYKKSLTVPRNYEGTFKVMHADKRIYKTVKDLVKTCPFIVRAKKMFIGSKNEDILLAGDKLRLIRMIQNKDGVDLLECNRVRGSKLLLLPMECNSGFSEVENSRFFTIKELTEILPRRRRLTFSDEYTSCRNPIEGMPSGFSGVIDMEEPEFTVTAHPQSNPGLLYHLNLETPIDVSPREITYETVTTENFDLEWFVQKNKKSLPFVCRIMDWEEATFALEWNKMYPETEVTLYKEERIDKILAECRGVFYSIPVSYKGYFKRDTQSFQSVSDLEAVRPKCYLQVTVGAKCDVVGLDDLCIGDVLRLAEGDWCLKQFQPAAGIGSRSSSRDLEVDVLLLIRHNRTTFQQEQLLRVPLYMKAEFKEVIQGSLPFTLEKIHLDYPVNVWLVHDDPEFGEDSCLPTKDKLKLHGPYKEDCILAFTHRESPNAPIEMVAIPLWTKIAVSYVRQNILGNEGIQIVNSSANSCPDHISHELANTIIEAKIQTYEAIAIAMPPLSPRSEIEKHANLTQKRPQRPPKSHKLLGSLKSPSQSTPPRPTYSLEDKPDVFGYTLPKSDQGDHSHGESDDEADYIKPIDYEYIKDIEEIKLPSRKLCIPKDGNLYNFSVNEMATFFAKMCVDKDNIRQCVQRCIDGHAFAKLTHHSMNTLGLTTNPIIGHFRENTKPKSKLASIFRLT